ncbi:MAG TPA: amino acid adenylation domain-containing protein, partial [Thermoanaerobaculia bacterium]|nr:amino acid adenylation domain-containing protein [Thermoanaerobaculia bacterium]
MTPRRSPTGPDIVRRRAAEHPSRPAFTFLDSAGAEAETLTRSELEARSLAVAAALQESGAVVSRGERVLLLHPPGLGFITSFLGCLYAGAVAVPAYPPGRNRPAARLRSIAADARPRVVLAPSNLKPGAVTGRVAELADALWIATDTLEAALAGAWRAISPGPNDPAFLQYTSGSTSDPKGVVVTHGSLAHNEEAIRRAFGQSESSVVVGWLPLYHDMGLIGNVLQPLYTGARAVLMAPLSFLQRPALWLEAVSRYRATTSGGPNFAYDLCVRKVSEEEKAGLDLASWEVAFNGAEPVRADTLERFAAAFASCGFRRGALFPCYGLAEATLFVTGGSPAEPPVVRAVEGPGSRERVGCGRAAPDLEVVIADPEAHTPCEPGRVGEIWVAGPSVAAGYWGRPEETARTFQARLADGRGPFLRTGDLGSLAGGELFVTGRIKDLIILRGRNIYPQDVERTAEESHPSLRPGGGAAFSIERGGEERLVLLHEVERSAGADPATRTEALEAVRRAVAEEHEVAVEEVVLLRGGTILKTSSGKIRRSACRAAYLTGELAVVARSGPSPDIELGSRVVVPPPLGGRAVGSGGGQEGGFSLAEEVARVLRRRVEEIEPEAPLTALGLDSLGAAELRSAVESRMGATVSMTALLEGVSLRELEGLVRAAERGEAPALLGAEPDLPGEHPLSEGQRDLWVLDRLNPKAAAGNLAGAAWLLGGIDGAALGRALILLTERHAALRTTFETREGEPVRRVHGRLAPDYREGRAGEEELPGLLVAEAYRPFELETGPLLRVRVWTLPDGRVALLLAVHHLIVDFASAAVLLRDLAALYDQERGGAPARLGHSGPGLTAWIRHREAALAGPREERLRAFWHQRLAGELPVLDLPVDRSRPLSPSWRGRTGSRHVDGLAGALRQVGRGRGATLFGSLLAGFQAVLHRWSGHDEVNEVLVGTPTSVRGGLHGEVGYFVNPVVLRLGLVGEPGFADLAGQAGGAAVEAFEHGDYPIPRLARDLGAQRGAGRPLFQAMLALQPTRHPEERALAPFALGEDGARVALGGIELESIALDEIRAQVDLTLMAAETERGGLALALQLDADLFDEATAGRLLGHLTAFLSGAAADPARPVAEIEILSPAEHSQIATWSAGSPLTEPADVCLHDLIARQTLLTPEAVAVESGGERLTYDELLRRSADLAARLRSLGVGPEVRVGVCIERGPRMVVGLLAVLEAGGAYVPLDPAYPAERLSLLLADSGARLALTSGETDVLLSGVDLPRVRIDDRPETPGEPGVVIRPSPGNLAYLIYTSGSTGRPKAVAVEHRSAVALVRWARRAFSDRELDGVLATTSIGFDLSVFELFVPLCWGGRVVFAGSAGSILDLPDLPPSTGVRLVNTVPSALAEVLRSGGLPPSVETVNLAGEPLRRDLVQALYGAGVRRVVNLYGPSEDTTYSTVAEQEPDSQGEPPIGRPVDGTWARVLDSDLRPVPVGVAGELFLGGAGLARGYLGRPELTAERFVPSPFAEEGAGARLYRTGDRARWRADGELLYLGRLDHQVKIRGFRVEPGEIEAVLASHPEVEQAVVLAQGEEGGRRLVAYVIPAGEGSVPDLRAWLEQRLPGSLVPSVFVTLESFPRTPNGKVDRRALADLAPGPAEGPRTPPRTPLEAAMAALWTEVLEIPEVGVHDRFFDLGGHSLLAVRLLARVRERLGVDLPLTAVFQAPTVAGLARLAAAAPPWRLPPPVPLPRDGSPFPLSFAQERMWLLHRLDPESPAYHVAGEVRLTGSLDVAALAAALDDLVRCHEALRTRFPEGEGGPVQVVEPVSPLALQVIDLSDLPEEVRSAEAERLALAMARRPFDLAAAPPVRALLLRLDGDEHRLLLTLHHAAADEASLDILSRDLGAAYDAVSQGLPSPVAPPPLQMADVAVWQRGRMAGEALAARLAWWEERLAGLPSLELPADRPAPAAPGWQGGTVTRPLPDETAAALAAVAREAGATLFMVLLAGFEGLLARLSGAVDFAVGSPFSTRDRRELEGVVGPLLNSLVLRADVAGDPPFRELVKRVREATVAAHERADLPFELLVERLRPERRAGANPLFDVAFILHRPPVARHSAHIEMTPRALPTGAVKFDLALYALETDEGIELALEHAADRWDEATAIRLLGHLTTLLARAVTDPERRLSELLPLTPAERQATTVERPSAASGASRTRLTPVEELLAGIWEDLLGVERPGPGDDFFALGGQSLLAARVVSRLRQALGVELPLRALFEEKTLAGMAARVESTRRAGPPYSGPPLVPVPREGGLPLSFGQERLWFLDRLDPGSPVYNMPGAVRLVGDLEPERLRAALEGIAARHEVLRAAFPAPAGEPVQVARPAAGLPLPRVDLSSLAPEARRAETLRRTTAEALCPFELETGPPLRATLLRLGEREHVLLLTVHHIAFDGWSLGVLLRELAALYAGEGERLPELPVQYADFAVW